MKSCKYQSLLGLYYDNALSEKENDEIADHLNAGLELATSPGEAEEIAQLNLRVGQKAKAATAYTAAANYLKTGREILTESGWQNQYQLRSSLAGFLGGSS